MNAIAYGGLDRMRVLIGVDVGTTKTKAAAFDLDGRLLARAERVAAMQRPRPGWAEQDPDARVDQVERLVLDLLAQLPGAEAAAIGICGLANTHVFADAELRALGPAITWQDQRCAEVAAQLSASTDRPVDASALLARAAWMRREQPATWELSRWVLSPKDYVNAHLTGAVATDPVSTWALLRAYGGYKSLDHLVPGVERRLPPLRDLAAPVGRTRKDGRLPAGVPVAVGTMDAWSSLYGSGAVDDGDAFELAGTSEVVGALRRGGPGAPGVVAFPPYDGMHVIAGPTQAGGDALRWYAQTANTGIADVLRAAATAPVGSRGVTFLPQLAGERAPLWDPHLRGAFLGLAADHAAPDLARAVLEGVAYAARHVLETVEAAAGAPTEELMISGGGAASEVWCQIKADVLGRPLVRVAVLDSGVLGAAIMGGVAAGLLDGVRPSARAFARGQRLFEPREEHRERYEEGYALYREAQDALAPIAHRAAAAAAARAARARRQIPKSWDAVHPRRGLTSLTRPNLPSRSEDHE